MDQVAQANLKLECLKLALAEREHDRPALHRAEGAKTIEERAKELYVFVLNGQ